MRQRIIDKESNFFGRTVTIIREYTIGSPPLGVYRGVLDSGMEIELLAYQIEPVKE